MQKGRGDLERTAQCHCGALKSDNVGRASAGRSMPLSIVPTPYRLCGALWLALANPKSELKETIRFTLAKAIVDFHLAGISARIAGAMSLQKVIGHRTFA